MILRNCAHALPTGFHGFRALDLLASGWKTVYASLRLLLGCLAHCCSQVLIWALY